MNSEEFWAKYSKREFDALYPEFKKGLEFEFDIKHEVKQASWIKDYELLFFLWKVGAQPETPFIQNVFERFVKGDTHYQMIEEENRKKELERSKVAVDLTSYDSVKDIPIDDIYLILDENSNYYLIVDIKPYLYDNSVIDLGDLQFGPLDLHQKIILNQKKYFNEDFGESIYLFHAHNPVDLKSIEFQMADESTAIIRADLLFDFEFGRVGNKEMRVIEKIIPIDDFRYIFAPTILR